MSLTLISFIIQCVMSGFAVIIFLIYFIRSCKVKVEAKKALKAIENEKKERELYIKLSKKYESEVLKK